MKAILAASIVSLGLGAGAATIAQEAHTVHFARGTTGASIKGTITGDDYIDYRLSASSGQEMVVYLEGTPYFNVLAPGSHGEAVFIGSNEGSEFGGTLSLSGTYTIRIYQLGAAEDEGHANRFTLEVAID